MFVKTILTRWLVLLFALLPLTVAAQERTQLAKWTFDTGYTVAEGVYTPNDAAWAQVGWNQFNPLPKILPNSCVGTASDYYVSAKGTRFWGILENYDAKVLQLYQDQDPNNITDYTDASQHNQYFEVNFPTKGYKNIELNFAFTCNDNVARDLEVVVSTDGGQTWADAGAQTGAANWWIYSDNKVSISANNKDKVIVRLIAQNGATCVWRMNEISISGEKQEEAKPVDEKGMTLSWPLGKGTDDVTGAVASVQGLFSVAEFDLGKLTVSRIGTAGTCVQTLYKPSNDNGAVNDDDVLTFTLKPKKGLKFAPKSFKFEASRWGTNGGKFDVVAIAGGQETTLETGVTPARNNEFSTHSYDLSALTTDENGLVLKIKIYNLASAKEYGFANVVVTGDMTGTPEAVPTYTMSVKLGMEGAGNVSCNPAGGEFDEGTLLTVKATENFGYHFVAWTDNDGKEVSKENPYSFEIKQNTALIATYTKKNVYALNLKLEGGANANLVQFVPEGNVIDGVHHYEEGTDVKLTTLNNRILTFTQWEDNTTSVERDVKMDGEKNLTATFSAVDYIVGWDLFNAEPRQDRAADYKSDSENAGVLQLMNKDGQSNAWLGQYRQNRYAALAWRAWTDNNYFQISFSSKGYQNLKLSAAVGDDYWAHQTIYAQYSTDGTSFTTFGTYTLPERGWTEVEFDLPAEANDQQRVWIRWMPDYNSPTVGVENDNDGTMVTDIFVLAESKGGTDETATLFLLLQSIMPQALVPVVASS